MNQSLKAALLKVFDQSCAHALEYGGAIKDNNICAVCQGQRRMVDMSNVVNFGDSIFHTHVYDPQEGLFGRLQPPSAEDIWSTLFTTKTHYIVCKDVIWALKSMAQNPPNDFKRILLIYDTALKFKFFELCEQKKKSASIQFIKQNYSSLDIDVCRFAGSDRVCSAVMKKYNVNPEGFDFYYSLLLKSVGMDLFKISTF